jgi:hypothetical protein
MKIDVRRLDLAHGIMVAEPKMPGDKHKWDPGIYWVREKGVSKLWKCYGGAYVLIWSSNLKEDADNGF